MSAVAFEAIELAAAFAELHREMDFPMLCQRTQRVAIYSVISIPQRYSVARGDSQRIVLPPIRASTILPQINGGLLVGNCGDEFLDCIYCTV